MKTGKVVLVMVAVALAGFVAPANAEIFIGGATAEAWVTAGAAEGIAVTLTAIPANEASRTYSGSGSDPVFDAPDRDGLNRGTLGLGVDNTLIKSGDDGVSSKPSEIGYYGKSGVCGAEQVLDTNCGDELRVALGQEVYGGSVTVSLFYGGEQAGETLVVQLYRDGALVYKATEGPAGNGEFNKPANNPGFYTFDLGAVCWDEIRFLGDEAIVNDAADYLVEGISNLTLCAKSCETDLIAAGGDGIGIDVGSVTTQLGETGWDVLFTSTAPWEIAEVHLDVACDPSELAQTRKGNPIPGQFCFQDTLFPGSQSYLFEDVLAKYDYCNHSLCGGDECTYFAAHAVVRNYANLICDDEAGRIFGVELGTGDLYEINLTDATATIVADIDDPVPGNVNSPNGLAFDVKRGFWYFSAAGVSNSTIWFWDGENQVNAGEVPGEVAGAAFFNGEYYYIVNETDDLVKVQFAEDGSVTGVLDVCSDFAGEPDTFRFGDIVISPDGSMLYGSSIGSGDPTVFFAIDMSTCDYTAISADGGDGSGLQLALGSDGKLYGHSTGTGVFYEVDPLTGTTTPLVGVDAVLGLDNPLIGAINNFTDLGAGPCSPWEETAWGSGTQFDGNNWGMYFGCNCEDESIESPE